MTSPAQVAQDMPTRLTEVGKAVRDAEGALRLRRQQRREVILEAVDREGMTQREVARLLGIRQSRLSAILATPDEEE
jgi:predicted XRE-type DNA-binding protein